MAEEGDTGNVEAQAREMGWEPKEEFKGNPEKWVDAESYVERGLAIMPIMQANNKRLLSEVTQLRGQMQDMAGTNKRLAETIEALKDFQQESAKQQFERAKQVLMSDKKEALKEGDHDAVVEIDEALDQLKEKSAAAAKKEEIKPTTPAPALVDQPWYKEWLAANPWFDVDPVKSGAAIGIGRKLIAGGMRPSPELLKKISEEVDVLFNSRSSGEKVEGSRGGAGSSSTSNGSGGKTYSSLPQDAKDACERFAGRLVGKDKAWKTVDEYRKHYVQQYYAE